MKYIYIWTVWDRHKETDPIKIWTDFDAAKSWLQNQMIDDYDPNKVTHDKETCWCYDTGFSFLSIQRYPVTQ